MTEEMIEAGKNAYWGHYAAPYNALNADECFTNQIKAIYEAMRELEDCNCCNAT